MYPFWGLEIIQMAFDNAEGKLFELLALDNRCVSVSDPRQIKELDNALDTVLSLEAASEQVSHSNMLDCSFTRLLNRRSDATAYLYHARNLLFSALLGKGPRKRGTTSP